MQQKVRQIMYSTKFGRWSMQIWQVERKFGIPGHSIFYLL